MSDQEDNIGDDGIENGHISGSASSSPNHFYSVESETDEEDDISSQTVNGRFDIELPTSHKYLGRLNRVSGDNLYEDGEILTMLALQTHTLVLPGFTLPLVMNNHYENNVMQTFIENKNVFVLLCSDEHFRGLFEYGVTMEIFETDLKNGVLNLKARGQQRCQIVPGSEIRVLAGRLQQVTVKILPEYCIKSPLVDSQLLNLKSKRMFSSEDYGDIIKCRKYRRYHVAQFPLASWIYEMFELCYFVKHIVEGLSKYFIKDVIPKDPTKLSYWFIQNFLLQHQERLYLMKQSTVLERLRYELESLSMERKILCNKCKICIAEQKDIFAMSKDGIQSNYVNPGGYVFETVTVSEAKNFELYGSPSRQFSWFPGYAWTIMQCQQCRQHLGWKFSSPNLLPDKFYGLAKSSFDVAKPERDESKFSI